MTQRNRGADVLAQAIARAGIRRIFTLSGNHIMPVFDAALDEGIELIHVRHEAAAVHMADAHARLTGECGVALVTGGPGHANASAALYTAAMAESPVVLLSGHAPLAQLGKGAFQEMRQAEVVKPLTKASGMSRGPESVGRDFAFATRVARAGRPGPVHLSLPQDVLEARASAVAPDEFPKPTATDADAAALLARLAKAQRPMILTGPVTLTKAGRARLAALEAASGIPVVGMESPRGIADPALGAFGEVLAKADCILLLGKRLDFTLKFGAAPFIAADCEFLQVDPEPSEAERTRRAVGERLAMHALGEALATVDALAAAATRASGGWLDEVRSAIAFRPAAWDGLVQAPGTPMHPALALRPLQALLDAHPDAVLVSDGGEVGQWAQACLSAPNRVINGVAGSIGASLPFAAGARVARPDAPIVAVMGDGTFGFHSSEVDTAARYRLPYLAVVGNDARWNAEYQIQLRDYGRERLVGCELLPTRYDQVAVAFGGAGESVERAADVLPAARRLVSSGKPAVLNVAIEGVPAPDIRR